MKADIVTSDDIKIYCTGKFQDFTAWYIIKALFSKRQILDPSKQRAKSLQTTILNLMIMKESSQKG